jgi:hypothetical protein
MITRIVPNPRLLALGIALLTAPAWADCCLTALTSGGASCVSGLGSGPVCFSAAGQQFYADSPLLECDGGACVDGGGFDSCTLVEGVPSGCEFVSLAPELSEEVPVPALPPVAVGALGLAVAALGRRLVRQFRRR